MKEVIEKLQPYLKHKQDCNMYRPTANDMDKGIVPDCDCGFDQALSLLKDPPCQTCGGSGIIVNPLFGPDDPSESPYGGCPDCQQECETCGDTKKIYGDPYGEPCPKCQPDAGDLIVYLRRLAKEYRTDKKYGINEIANEYADVFEQAAAFMERQAKKLEAYSLLEEISPPDIPRKKFVEMLMDAWQEKNRKETE